MLWMPPAYLLVALDAIFQLLLQPIWLWICSFVRKYTDQIGQALRELKFVADGCGLNMRDVMLR